MAQNRSFPGWAGPIVGPIAGWLVGLQASRSSPTDQRGMIIIGAAAFGLVAGLIVWFLDARKSRSKSS